MSERQEKRRRQNLRLKWCTEFTEWLIREPPMWRVFSWSRWKAQRPIWKEV